MARVKLPNRRHGVRVPVSFTDPMGHEYTHFVTYNLGPDLRVAECFISHDDKTKILKSGSLFRALIEDGCIAISLLLQHGLSMGSVAAKLGENHPEGASTGPPSSPLGAIARAGAEIDQRAKWGEENDERKGPL